MYFKVKVLKNYLPCKRESLQVRIISSCGLFFFGKILKVLISKNFNQAQFTYGNTSGIRLRHKSQPILNYYKSSTTCRLKLRSSFTNQVLYLN